MGLLQLQGPYVRYRAGQVQLRGPLPGSKWGPYTYVGNNPFAYVDPDGDVFITALFILAGANIGGSVAMGNWDPNDRTSSK